MQNDKKSKKHSSENGGMVYSTNKDFDFSPFAALASQTADATTENTKQDLRVQLDKKQRGGKKVTLITGFIGTETELETLGKLLKTKCGVGGSAKDGEIIIQGDFVQKALDILVKEGYKAKKIGGYNYTLKT
jgi:translation initiation factor 1